MDNCYFPGKPLNKDLLDENTSWHDTLETLQNELSEAGVGKDHTWKLSCFLYVTGQTELLTDVQQALSKNARECIARFMDD